jgi:lysophospholipase L1-like esterase
MTPIQLCDKCTISNKCDDCGVGKNGVSAVDIGAQFLDGDGNIPADIMADKVHLSTKGYAISYRSLESILPGMLK